MARSFTTSSISGSSAKVQGRIAGHWRYAFYAPDGTTRLAQWSGECEVPIAYFVASDGTSTIATGESDMTDAPESEALGWVDNGAIVQVLKGACAGGGRPPGIYSFTSPGVGDLLYRTQGYATAHMWGRGHP